MLIDGRRIAQDIRDRLREDFMALKVVPILGFIRSGDDLVAQKFVGMKTKAARELGIRVVEFALPPGTDTDGAITAVENIASQTDGIIVQMPLAAPIDAERVLQSVPIEKDVDAMGERSGNIVLTPVVGAIQEILSRVDISVQSKKVVVVGAGKLVGAPAASWFKTQGALISVVTRAQGDIESYTKDADIIVLGAGVPGILKPAMIKEGVVIIDAGTSESEGALKGDADPDCGATASFFTPVPGGVGPIAVAMIFKNLFELAEKAPLQEGR